MGYLFVCRATDYGWTQLLSRDLIFIVTTFKCFPYTLWNWHLYLLVPHLEIINVMSLIIDLKKDIPQIHNAQITSFRLWMNDMAKNNPNDEVDMIYFFVLANITFFRNVCCLCMIGRFEKEGSSVWLFIHSNKNKIFD